MRRRTKQATTGCTSDEATKGSIAPASLRPFVAPSLVAMMVLLTGCQMGPPASRFAVEVMNIAPTAISAGFVKLNGGLEEHWVSPTDIAIHQPEYSDNHWGVAIKPGETRVVGPFDGHFEPGAIATLRIYGGDVPVNDLVLVGSADPDRVDVPLHGGRSSFVVTQRGGRLTAVPASEYHATPERPPEAPVPEK